MNNAKLKVEEIWETALEKLKEKLPGSIYEAWVVNLAPNAIDENEFSVLCGQRLAMQMIRPHQAAFEQVLSEIINKECVFKIIFSEELSKALKRKLKKSKSDEDRNNIYPGATQMISCPLNVKFKFDNFVVGSNSELAYAGAVAVSKNPGKTAYNPLFIYGNSGVGKTHLLQAIGHSVFEKGLKIKYCNCEEFVNDYVHAVAKGLNKGHSGENNTKMKMLRQKYRECDLLLIDDIQFLEGKKETQTEIFNTFESLYNNGKQIVLTSDRHPSAISTLTERLKTRFSGGLLVDIQPPDLETRMAILENLSAEEEMPLAAEIVDFLAVNYGTNVRELKGAFNKIKLFYSLGEKALDLNSVKKVLNFKENQKNYTPETIISSVASYFNVSEDELLGSGRMKNIANARQVAIYLIRELTKNSFPVIGQIFDKKHSTIIYSYENMQKQIKIDTHLKNAVDEIQKGLE